MSRLIDANALIAKLEDDAKHIDDNLAIMFTYAAINDIKHEPTVDAVEVIRCRDCRYSVDEYHDGDCYCRRPSRAYVPEWIGDWDFYCKEAERRQDDKH